MKQFSSLLTERLKLNKDTKINKNEFVILKLPPFNSRNHIFLDKFYNRKFKVWARRIKGYVLIFVITIDEAKDFWGNDLYGSNLNKKPILYKIPEQDTLDVNSSGKEIENFIKDHDKTYDEEWDPINFKNNEINLNYEKIH